MTGAQSKWELMLSPKPCAVCGANGFWVNRDGVELCEQHRLVTPDEVAASSGHRSAMDRLWGCGDIDIVFHRADRVLLPWVRASRHRGATGIAQATHLRATVSDILARPARLMEVAPRHLRATQPWALRQHVSYYLTGAWERTGFTSADRDSLANRYPTITLGTEQVIHTGHHRALAALIQGRALLARTTASDPSWAVAVTPSLHVGTVTPLPAISASTPTEAADVINNGGIALVATQTIANATLNLLTLASGGDR